MASVASCVVPRMVQEMQLVMQWKEDEAEGAEHEQEVVEGEHEDAEAEERMGGRRRPCHFTCVVLRSRTSIVPAVVSWSAVAFDSASCMNSVSEGPQIQR